MSVVEVSEIKGNFPSACSSFRKFHTSGCIDLRDCLEGLELDLYKSELIKSTPTHLYALIFIKFLYGKSVRPDISIKTRQKDCSMILVSSIFLGMKGRSRLRLDKLEMIRCPSSMDTAAYL